MSRDFSIGTDIAAPPSRVWDVLSDIERWHEWTESVTSAKRLDTGPLVVGSKVILCQPKLPPAEYTVTALEDGKGFAFETRSPGALVVGNHRIEPANGGSRVTLSLKFSGLIGPTTAFMMRKMINRYLEMDAAGLKKRCEAKL